MALHPRDGPFERPQEVDDVLLVWSGQPPEARDDPIGLAPGALVVLDSLYQIACASVVEEEDALPDAPKRGGSELIGACATLRDAVRQTPAHAVDEEVGPSSTSGMQQVVGRIPGYCFDLYVVCSS